MDFYIQTHTVKKGENLEIIAEKYNISDVEMLRYYHNQNCSLTMQIGKTVLPGQEILVPNQKDIDKIIFKRNSLQLEKQNKKINSLENERLLPNFVKLNHVYNIKITDSQKEEKFSENITEFETHLKYVSKDNEGNNIIACHRKNAYINNEIPQLKVYDFALKCASCLNFIEFTIDLRGNIIGIHNQKKILDLWNNDKKKLQQLYEDQYSLRYIEKFDFVIRSQSNLTKHIKRDLFLQFYFSSFYTDYENSEANTVSKFTMYNVDYQNNYKIELDDFITIDQNSECIDQREQQEILAYSEIDKEAEEAENSHLLESQISAKYYVNTADNILHKVDIEIRSFFYGIEETTQIEIISNRNE